MQDKKPKNELGQRHGLWQDWFTDTVLYYEGHYVNDVDYGFWIERITERLYYAR